MNVQTSGKWYQMAEVASSSVVVVYSSVSPLSCVPVSALSSPPATRVFSFPSYVMACFLDV